MWVEGSLHDPSYLLLLTFKLWNFTQWQPSPHPWCFICYCSVFTFNLNVWWIQPQCLETYKAFFFLHKYHAKIHVILLKCFIELLIKNSCFLLDCDIVLLFTKSKLCSSYTYLRIIWYFLCYPYEVCIIWFLFLCDLFSRVVIRYIKLCDCDCLM